ncbi:zinc-dependent alcohol dehydrogenase [Pseudomonas citronellolis]|uniref:zinc-dependent alcohol dehydrogenase n=1 Tax=Pseudomonas citronellolis TaxID=53408 RepID=UPI0021C1BF35|nr:alcohol dehydrogenase catalytic domain-containing protein [Pseudomonas citronellolis]UXJ50297.1 alcohol dehydrogenase catalytic domain-containing protein [Pseudomonas citronellolis]
MKAAVFKGVGVPLAIEERPDPVPGPGEIIVRVGRVGVCGTDIHMTSGHGQQAQSDSVIGHEFAGEVVALGDGVSRIKLGDRVAPMPFFGCGRCSACLAGYPIRCPEVNLAAGGAFSQYARGGQNDCVILPPELSDEDGALIEPLAVGLHGVRQAKMDVGAKVLIMGAGAIGLSATFWAKRLGASRLAVTANSGRRAAIAKAMGADYFIPQKDVGDANAAIHDALGGPPDVVIEAVGMAGALGQAINFVKMDGTIVSLGFLGEPDTIVPAIAMWKGIRIQFSNVYERRDFQYVADVMAAGDHTPRQLITSTVSLDALPPKFESLRGASSDVKVMIDPWA